MKIEATIRKADIAPLHALVGLANAEPIVLAGAPCGVGHVVFDGFAGRLFQDGLYHGVLSFTPVDGDVNVADFSMIDRIINVSEVSDELQCDND